MPLEQKEAETLQLKRLFGKMNSGSQDPMVRRLVDEAKDEIKKLEGKEK
jgi:hypothetical protein